MECGWTSGSFFYHLTKLLYHDVAVVLQHWDVFVTVMILLGGAILNNSAVEMPPRTGAIITFLLRKHVRTGLDVCGTLVTRGWATCKSPWQCETEDSSPALLSGRCNSTKSTYDRDSANSTASCLQLGSVASRGAKAARVILRGCDLASIPICCKVSGRPEHSATTIAGEGLNAKLEQAIYGCRHMRWTLRCNSGMLVQNTWRPRLLGSVVCPSPVGLSC